MFVGKAWPLDLAGALTVGLALFYWAAQYQGLRTDEGVNTETGEAYDQF